MNTTSDGERRALLARPTERAPEAPERRARPVAKLTPEERIQEATYVASSLRTSRATIAGALAVGCGVHAAAPGDPCWGGYPGSRARGICVPRYRRGIAEPVRVPEPPEFGDPDGLAKRAQAVRNARRDARIREREAAAAQRRHPNRHQAPHTPAGVQR